MRVYKFSHTVSTSQNNEYPWNIDDRLRAIYVYESKEEFSPSTATIGPERVEHNNKGARRPKP